MSAFFPQSAAAGAADLEQHPIGARSLLFSFPGAIFIVIFIGNKYHSALCQKSSVASNFYLLSLHQRHQPIKVINRPPGLFFFQLRSQTLIKMPGLSLFVETKRLNGVLKLVREMRVGSKSSSRVSSPARKKQLIEK